MAPPPLSAENIRCCRGRLGRLPECYSHLRRARPHYRSESNYALSSATRTAAPATSLATQPLLDNKIRGCRGRLGRLTERCTQLLRAQQHYRSDVELRSQPRSAAPPPLRHERVAWARRPRSTPRASWPCSRERRARAAARHTRRQRTRTHDVRRVTTLRAEVRADPTAYWNERLAHARLRAFEFGLRITEVE